MKLQYEQDYINLMTDVLNSPRRETRNGATYSTFAKTLVITELCRSQMPMLSYRRLYYEGVVGELAAFLNGVTSVEDFEKFGCNYWKQWADEDGALRLDYGNTWRNFEGFDQLTSLIRTLKTAPTDRRMIISSWRPHALDTLSLPCCHLLYQFYVNNDNELEMLWMQRSVDLVVGLPSDVILASVLTILLAKEANLKPGKITMVFGDTHIYAKHVSNVELYLSRATSSGDENPIPSYTLNDCASINNFHPSQFAVTNYLPYPPIKSEVIA